MVTRLLCIEDDADTRELLTEALTGRGFAVTSAPDGETGLDAIRDEPPDLVICDVKLPGISGFEVLKRLARIEGEKFGSIPFVFLTALTDRESILIGRKLGADDYVTKPVDFDILAEIVKRRLAPYGRPSEGGPELSKREVEVLTWVARGKSSTDIGALLGLSDRTVDYHVENAMRKLGVATRVQAVVKAVRATMIRI